MFLSPNYRQFLVSVVVNCVLGGWCKVTTETSSDLQKQGDLFVNLYS